GICVDIRKSMSRFVDAYVSIGVAFWGNEQQSIRSTLKEADTALYRAKNNGRNRSEIFYADK
ncbi:MAG: GGDEF domain-containing protein, partial [Vibrio toranzoniae]